MEGKASVIDNDVEVVSSVENSKSVDMVSEPVMEAGNLLRNIETESLSHMDVDPDRGRAKRVHSDSDPELDIPISKLKHIPGLRCNGKGMGRDGDMAVSGGKEGVS